MRVKLKFEREDIYWIIALSVLAVVLFTQVPFSWVALVGFIAGYAGIKWLVIEWKESLAWLWTTLAIVLSSVFSTHMVQYLLLDAELRAKIKDDKLWLNMVCCMVLYSAVHAVTNNVAVTCMISHIALMLLAGVNYFVFMFRGNEFIFSDIRSAATGLSVAGNYEFIIDERAVYVILLSVLYVAFVHKWNISFTSKKLLMRAVCVSAAILGCVYVSAETADTVTETWEQKGSYRNGYILNFVLSVRDYFVQPPEGYSAEAVALLEKEYTEYAGDMPEEKPTVIVIMSESYADLSVVGDLKTNQEVTPYYNSLTENTIKGYALSSIFGAKTANSEWEFMSGNSMAFLPDGDEESAYQAAMKLIAVNPELTAIACSTDLRALGVMQAVEDSGRRIPAFAVTGIDDVGRTYYDLPENMTTVHLPFKEIGEALVNMAYSEDKSLCIRMAPALVVRQTS